MTIRCPSSAEGAGAAAAGTNFVPFGSASTGTATLARGSSATDDSSSPWKSSRIARWSAVRATFSGMGCEATCDRQVSRNDLRRTIG